MKDKTRDIAIIGMACIFPGAPNLQSYWQNIISKVDAVGDPPEDWRADLFYDPDSTTNDRTYCKRGGYLGNLARFDPLKYGVMPNSIDGGEPDQFLALRVAHEALADAGYLDGVLDKTRVEVILGRGTYINRGLSNVVQHGLVVDQLLRILKQLHPEHTEEELRSLRQELKASLPPFNAEMAPGLVPNLVSGRIANRLDFMGPNYTVDAACASSHVAIDRGAQDLLDRRCDLAIVGGVHASTPAPILMIFSQLNALSHKGQIRPFGLDADGTLLGEGVGLIVIKRRDDAERDGDRIYAVIKAVGTASDGRALGLLAPRVEGEELALRRAYETAGISPDTVELIEAHGTGTPVGDLAEIQALGRVFGARQGGTPRCALGSVKSMISHLIPASGIAGVIKTALALYHKVLPPTLHCEEPNPKLELEKTPFYLNTETRPWVHGTSAPRRAGVNAFGFGGINAHAILEEYDGAPASETATLQHLWETEACVIQGASREEMIRRAEQLRDYLSGSPQITLKDLAYTLNSGLGESGYRLAVVASSLTELEQKLTRALERLASPDCVKIKDPNGLYYFEEQLSRTGKVAFIFPGEGSQYVNMLSDLCVHFPEVRAWFDLIDRTFIGHERNYLPSQIIYPPPGGGEKSGGADEARLWQMDLGPEAIFAANQAMLSLLNRLRVRPHAVVGHSTGEYSALAASGANPIENEEQLTQDILKLNQFYEQLLAEGQIPEGMLLMVGGAERESVLSLVERTPGLYLAMDNCPHQIVLCGTDQTVAGATEHLRAKGAICTPLPFKRAYHTPMFEPFCERLREFMQGLKIIAPEIEMYSCTTAQPYPRDPAEVRRVAAEQWARPVRFRETVQAMYDAGVRIFIEVGPRNNLTSFVDDILRGKPHLAVASNVPHLTGITQLNHLVALLAAHGVPMRLDRLYTARAPRHLSIEGGPEDREQTKPPRLVKLEMGLQPLRLNANPLRNRSDNGKPPSSADLLRGAASAESAGELSGMSGKATADLTAPQPRITAAGTYGPSHNGSSTSAAPADAAKQQRIRPTNGSRSQAMQGYLKTMEQFLTLQQTVMQTFINNQNSVPPSAPRHELRDAGSPASGHDIHAHREAGLGHAAGNGGGTLQLGVTQQPNPPAAAADVVGKPLQPEAGPAAGNGSEMAVAPDGASPEFISRLLLKLISERTGYPVDMLDPELDLEADLGIDSIKRVEIMGAFQQQAKAFKVGDMEAVHGLKTISQVVNYVTGRGPNAGRGRPSLKREDNHPQPDSAAAIAALPFIRTVTSLSPGEEIVALCQTDIDEDLFLLDHTLGRGVSTSDKELSGLPVVPLTVSMEMLAEAAAVLAPGKTLIGMREVRGHRWIALDHGRLTLQLTARRQRAAAAGLEEFKVEGREISDSATSGALTQPPAIKGVVIFGDGYPKPPEAGAFTLRSERPSAWCPAKLYTELMFHGPSFQGVASMDRTGEDGAEGTLLGLPVEHFFRSVTNTQFLSDVVPLDAAGQVVAFWTAELLERGFHIFPFRVEALHIYGPNLRPGELAKCRARSALVGDWQVRSDIDIVGPDGRMQTRIDGWWDKRFDLPDDFFRLRLSPREALVSRPAPELIAPLAAPEAFSCCLVNTLSPDFLEAGGKIWQRTLAHLILSRPEREAWRNLRGPERRRYEWLLGRAAAKDAVRLFLMNRYGMKLCPADVEIGKDEHGRPLARGDWTGGLIRPPVISLAHAGETAVAVAGDDGRCQGVGVDVERLGQKPEAFENYAFTAEELSLLASLADEARDEWLMRLWCAKEAVSKSLGRGLSGGPLGLRVRGAGFDDGLVEVSLSGGMAEEFPHLAGQVLTAHTSRAGDYVFAISLG